jgi:hypothetical protein
MKKTTISVKQAEQLEQAISNCIARPNPHTESALMDILSELGVPDDVETTIIFTVYDVRDDIAALKEGNIDRDLITDIVENLKYLDGYLGKAFAIDDGRYAFRTWST